MSDMIDSRAFKTAVAEALCELRETATRDPWQWREQCVECNHQRNASDGQKHYVECEYVLACRALGLEPKP